MAGFYQTILTRSWTNVAPLATAVLELVKDHTYHTLGIDYSGVTLAQLTNIKVKYGGVLYMEFATGTELDLFNQYNGHVAAGGILFIDFEKYNLTSRDARALTRLASADPRMGQVTVEVDIATGTTPVLSSHAIVSDPTSQGLLRKIQRFTMSTSGAGTFEFLDLPTDVLLQAIYLQSALVTEVELLIDQKSVWRRTATRNNRYQTDKKIRTPQTGLFVLDVTEDGDGSPTISTAANDVRLRVTTSGAATFPITAEILGPLQA